MSDITYTCDGDGVPFTRVDIAQNALMLSTKRLHDAAEANDASARVAEIERILAEVQRRWRGFVAAVVRS